jgi:molybdate transport system regulatory protein
MNRLPGRISAIDAHGSIALVEAEVGVQRFTAMLVGAGDEIGTWPAGMPVTLLFKETEVSLAKNLSGSISMRNRIAAVITAIERGTLLTHVTLAFDDHVIGSIITTRSSDALALAIGDTVEALVKTNEMSVMPEDRA